MVLDNFTEEEIKNINFSNKTILIVDDEEAYQKFLAKIIEKFLKAKVISANNPAEMFEIIENMNPDLIILDLQMPVMDGQTALRHISSNEKTENIPVVICSALGFESVIVNLAKLKISGFIIKPFEASTVLKKIYNVLIETSK